MKSLNYSSDSSSVDMAMLVSSNAKKLEDKHKVEIHEYYEDGEVVEHLVPFIKLPLSVNLKLAGKYLHNVENMCVVEPNHVFPLLNIDTILFFSDRTVFGPIHDIYGTIDKPKYIIGYHMRSFPKIDRGTELFYTDYYAGNTKYVNIPEAMKIKPSDASWLDDAELPLSMQDYSDDEKEREARRGKKKQKSRFPIQEPIRTTNLMDVRREPALHKYAPFVSNHRTLEAKPQYPTPHHNQFDGNQYSGNSAYPKEYPSSTWHKNLFPPTTADVNRTLQFKNSRAPPATQLPINYCLGPTVSPRIGDPWVHYATQDDNSKFSTDPRRRPPHF